MKKIIAIVSLALIIIGLLPDVAFIPLYTMFELDITSLAREESVDANESIAETRRYFPLKEYDEYMIENVPCIRQFPKYPSGCESVATVMALLYIGENITVDDFLGGYLETDSKFYSKDNRMHGPSPYEFFVGSPLSDTGWGCMAPVIEKALLKYTKDEKRVFNTTSNDLDELCARFVANDVPVIVWTTIAMLDVEYRISWGVPDGSLFRWPGNEHCMLLVGFDETHYYFNDPYTGCCVKYQKALAEDRYEKLGKQSLVVISA